jgi:hypothetical protein
MKTNEILQHEWLRNRNAELPHLRSSNYNIKPVEKMINIEGNRKVFTANQIISPFVKKKINDKSKLLPGIFTQKQH